MDGWIGWSPGGVGYRAPYDANNDDDKDNYGGDNDSDEKTKVLNEVFKSVTENISASTMIMMINLIVMLAKIVMKTIEERDK